MKTDDLIPHLFRTESGKITAVLGKVFGLQDLQLAEDITGETFLRALETWPYYGLPENPTGWLYAVAKNKVKNHLGRKKIFNDKVADAIRENIGSEIYPEIDLSDENISDSQLQMLFALCHPVIPVEAQIGLSLRILCGFGIDEIATAFLTNKETINKRLSRAKEKLRSEKISIEFPGESEVPKRLETVLTTLYLLFSEGYYSESQDAVLLEDLCVEAMRLTKLLTQYERTNLPQVNALLALMHFHASRFPARKNSNGVAILYDDQDETLWNYELITKGAMYLREASKGPKISKYHLEASIAYWHTVKADTREKWENILQLYNHLLRLEYSPVAALNRTYALSKANGKEQAIAEAEKLQLINNHYYFTLLGELYKGIDNVKAKENLSKALSMARTQTDKRTILQKLSDL